MASATLPPVGLIGLGTMGGAIAVRLLEQGVDLTVYDIDAASIARLRAATSTPVKVADSLEDLGRRSTIVLCSLAHPDILVEAITGPAGLHKGLARGSIVVDTSTSGPDVARRCGEFLAGMGCEMADATIGRGPAAALRGELVLMLGGSDATLDRIEPVIRMLAAKVVRCGGLGAAQVIKLANNLVACANLAVIAEAYRFVREQGADPRLLLEVMQGTYADSFQLQKSVAGKAAAGDFEIVFRLDLAAKDVRLICDAAAAKGLEPGIGAATLGWYDAAVAAGHGKIDWSAVMLVADPSLAPSTTR
jgi:3-hydroxyisobutyrate dehydrogenase-like beta-hydroxyacid dehydrogenase